MKNSHTWRRMDQRSPQKDLRKLQRFSLQLPTRLSILEPSGPSLDLVTGNISAGGAFFPTRHHTLPEGLKVLVELILKRESGKGGTSKVRVKGKVLRSQADGFAVGFENRVRFEAA